MNTPCPTFQLSNKNGYLANLFQTENFEYNYLWLIIIIDAYFSKCSQSLDNLYSVLSSSQAS